MKSLNSLNRLAVSPCGFETTPNSKGLLFVHPRFGTVQDLYQTKFQIVGTYVDTYRQLFKGAMNQRFLEDVEMTFDTSDRFYEFFGYDWVIGKSSKSSGYQYRLQNNDLGLILLFKMYHSKADTLGTHLKIECSPWFLENKEPEKVDQILHDIACSILEKHEPHYPAIHLATDVQGWKPDNNLSEKMRCRSRRICNYNGIDSAEFTLADVSCNYDRAQSFKFGSAGACQLAIYNKTIQAKTIDKFDYCEQKWKKSTINSDESFGYRPDDDVFRFEMRFHHSVIEQFSLGSLDTKTDEIGLPMKSYCDLVKHIQALWSYGFNSFKLLYNSNYFDPVWTILQDDVVFDFPRATYQDNKHYKRYYKKATSFSGKNYQLILGNYLSACARERMEFNDVLADLQKLNIWISIAAYYESREVPEHSLIDRLSDNYKERQLLGYCV